MDVFQLDAEPAELRESYGGEFGQRCLLSRRLIQSGVRFIEVSHNLNFINGTGWDTHNDGQLNQHLLIRELDSALSALVLDLEQHRLLDKTLIVVATEFGRPAQFDGGGGRGHHSKAFSIVLAGGGLHNGKTIGETDELGMHIVVTSGVRARSARHDLFGAGHRPGRRVVCRRRSPRADHGSRPADRRAILGLTQKRGPQKSTRHAMS